jgi:glycine/D-amino acid oxidase-like deaminating enzyme
MATWDTIIVGQGLAGTTLAWQLIDAGQRVLILDANEAVTTSKIAAGLITPITGQRIALSWKVEEFLPVARKFYRALEARTGELFFHDRRAVRLFSKDDERKRWAERRVRPEFAVHLSDPQPEPLVESELADASGGGFEMLTAQLDVAGYLAASMKCFQEMSCHRVAVIDWAKDVQFSETDVQVMGETASRVISCEGFAAKRNPYFSWVPFKAAKGDILTVKFSQPMTPRCLHAGIWLAPTKDPTICRVGATYDWHQLNQEPNPVAREELETKLRALVRLPFQVIHHQAAVRPIIHESKALLGLHPVKDRLGYFNGLGSKGSLHAPWFAACFTEFLVHGKSIPDDIDLRKNF